jgi:formylglycine-generating enzyme required for sulfatase activity
MNLQRKSEPDFPIESESTYGLSSRVALCKTRTIVSVLIMICVLFSVSETLGEHESASEASGKSDAQQSSYVIGQISQSDQWIAPATAGTGPNNSPIGESSGSIPEKVRKASQLILEGDTARARDLIGEALRECESTQGSIDCADWGQALRGLKSLLGKAADILTLTNSIGMKLVRIPAGEYMMGSPKQEMDWLRLTFKKTWRDGHKQWFQDEMPLHPVRITRSFYMGATTITVGQFRQFVKETSYKTDAEKGDGGMIYTKKEERWVPQK